MLSVNSTEEMHVAIRLLDFTDSRSPWPRKLWDVGTTLSLRELAEAADAVASGTLAPATLEWFRKRVTHGVGRDLGAGETDVQRRQLQELLAGKEDLRPGGAAYIRLRHLTGMCERGYLERWANAYAAPPSSKRRPERAARYIAAHLLDRGFSSSFLHGWLSKRIVGSDARRTLPELLFEAQELCDVEPRSFEVLVPFARGETGALRGMANWRSSRQVAEWLKANNSETSHFRPLGGLSLEVTARDETASAYVALELVERILLRAAIGSTKGAPTLHGKVWVKGRSRPINASRGRSLKIHALDRQGQIDLGGRPISAVDDAIELAAHMELAAPGPAIASGWAAFEALLHAPGDMERVVAADRLALLVACSFIRAELTALAHRHEGADELRASILERETNRERAQLLGEALVANRSVVFAQPSDFAAVVRMREMLKDPAAVIKDVTDHVISVFRRLYRLRNLILHQGKTDAVSLGAALRTATPLVGAGFDRVSHAWYSNGVTPVELATLAKLRSEVVMPGDVGALVRLLD